MVDFVNAAFAYLQGWSSTFRKFYAPGVTNALKRHGRTTRLMPTRRRRFEGNSIEYEIKHRVNRGTRVTMDLMKPMADPTPGAYLRFQVNFDHTDPAANDIAGFEVGFRTTIFDIWKRADRTWKDSPDFIRKDVEEGLADVKETFAKYLHLDENGLLATIAASGIVNDDADLFADGTDYTAGSSDAFLKLTASAIARIGDGQLVELRLGATLLINNVRVTYLHPHNESIAVTLTTDSEDASGSLVTNFDIINTEVITNTNTVTVYLSGNYGVSISGTLTNLFTPATAYYGNERIGGQSGYVAQNRYLLPMRINADSTGSNTLQDLTEDHFQFIGESAAWRAGSFQAKTPRQLVMSKYEYRKVVKLVKDLGITMQPALESDIGRKLVKSFGFDGFVLHDPSLGTVAITVDDFAEPGQIDFLDMSFWEIVSPIDGGFRMFPGSMAGIWNREGESDGTGRLGKTFSAQGIQLAAFVCTDPKSQARLFNLATT